MSIYAVIGGNLSNQIAANKGLGDVMRWLDRLNTTAFPLLSHLVDWGWVNDLDNLRLELSEAVSGKGLSASVKSVLMSIQDALSDIDGETIMLTNGLSTTMPINNDGWETS